MAWHVSLRMWGRAPVLTQGRWVWCMCNPNPQEADSDGYLGLVGQPPLSLLVSSRSKRKLVSQTGEQNLRRTPLVSTLACTPVLMYPSSITQRGDPTKSNLKSWNQEVILSNRLVFHRPFERWLQWMYWSKLSLNTRMYGLLFTLHGVYWVRNLGWSSPRRNFWRTISLGWRQLSMFLSGKQC